MATTPPQTHKAVATPATRAKLILLDRATEPPEQGEILVRVAWASSTPLNLHQADGGLLVTHPYILSSDYGGEVVAVGGADDNDPELHGIKVGDTVFGFAWRKDRERTHQEYVTVPAFLASRLPPNLTLQEAVTVPTNLVTAFHVLTKDLQLELPWPLPDGWTPPSADAPVLIWGAAGSVGTYCVQVLRHWRYRHILAVASGRHHAYLKEAGATACFDYGDPDVTARILEHVGPAPDGTGPRVPFVVDAIGSLDGTLAPLTRVAERGTRVAVMLPSSCAMPPRMSSPSTRWTWARPIRVGGPRGPSCSAPGRTFTWT